MFRRTSKDHKGQSGTPSRTKTNGSMCGDLHAGRDPFSDAEHCTAASPTSLESSAIDYESAFRAVMVENARLREENIELRRRAKLPLPAGTDDQLGGDRVGHRVQSVVSGQEKWLPQEPADLEMSVRELTGAVMQLPGRILVIVLVAGIVTVFKNWMFETCVVVA